MQRCTCIQAYACVYLCLFVSVALCIGTHASIRRYKCIDHEQRHRQRQRDRERDRQTERERERARERERERERETHTD